MLGVDYSFARIPASQLKAAGYDFACRYLATAAGKRISASEVSDLQNNGVNLVLVFEDNANQSLQGNAQGVADAQEALAEANSVGWPSSRPIYFAVDFDATPGQQAAIDAYLQGAASVIGADRVGVYGGYYVVLRCSQNGTAKWFWQTVAWSGGQVFSGAHIYQNGQSAFNGGADVDEAKQADFGQWGQGQGVNNMNEQQATQAVQNAYLLSGEQGATADQLAYHVPRAMADPGYISALEDQLYHGQTWQKMAYKSGHYDADVSAAYQKGLAEGKAATPATTAPLPNLVNNVPKPVDPAPAPSGNWFTNLLRKWGIIQ